MAGMMTEATAKALETLRDGPKTHREFAEAMWPDAPGWSVMMNSYRGVAKGKGMVHAAVWVTARLAKMGLVKKRWENGMWIVGLTSEGRSAICGRFA